MARPKGQPKYGGRQKGTINKVTAESKDLFSTIIAGHIPNIHNALNEVFETLEAKALIREETQGITSTKRVTQLAFKWK